MPCNSEMNRDWVVYMATDHSYKCVYMVSHPMHYNDATLALTQIAGPSGMRRATIQEMISPPAIEVR